MLVTIDADIIVPLKKVHIDAMVGALAGANCALEKSMAVCVQYEKIAGVNERWDLGLAQECVLESGQRAIRMKALNFLFRRKNATANESSDEYVFSNSKPAKRFASMAGGYGLESALDYAMGRRTAVVRPAQKLLLCQPYRHGRIKQVNEVGAAKRAINERRERLEILLNIRRETKKSHIPSCAGRLLPA